MEFDSLSLGSNVYTPVVPEPLPAMPSGTGKTSDVPNAPREMKAPPVNDNKELDREAQKAQKATTKELRISEDDIQKTIDTANKKIEPLFLEFQHRIHAKTNTLMISVINTSTKEVLREIPPEKTLDALAKMWELVGILVDKKG